MVSTEEKGLLPCGCVKGLLTLALRAHGLVASSLGLNLQHFQRVLEQPDAPNQLAESVDREIALTSAALSARGGSLLRGKGSDALGQCNI